MRSRPESPPEALNLTRETLPPEALAALALRLAGAVFGDALNRIPGGEGVDWSANQRDMAAFARSLGAPSEKPRLRLQPDLLRKP